VFTPLRLGGLALRNRVLKAATFEGMCPEGRPSEALLEHHRRIAAGGAAMTTVAYCSVSADGRTYGHQMLMSAEIVPALRRLTDAVHREGAAACLQLGHCGFFASRDVIGSRPLGPSVIWNTYGLSFARAMSAHEIRRVVADFGRAAALAIEAGFDAIEVHVGHGYLLSQFLSPYSNRRDDDYGGSTERRARFTLEVLRAVRDAVGPERPVLAKWNLRDGFAGGLEIDESIAAAELVAAEGNAAALVLSGGFVSKTPLFMLRGDVPLRDMVRVQDSAVRKLGLVLFGRVFVQRYAYEEAFFRDEALKMRARLRLPLVLLGGIKSLDVMERAMDDGFEMVAMARALIHDPDLPRKLERGEVARSGCVPCNRCIAEMDAGGVRCVLGQGPHS
jgi:2,4-dienoyl-CoA reductase-like NADH-dependent reductase (Old Yellow Enzyme family)